MDGEQPHKSIWNSPAHHEGLQHKLKEENLPWLSLYAPNPCDTGPMFKVLLGW